MDRGVNEGAREQMRYLKAAEMLGASVLGIPKRNKGKVPLPSLNPRPSSKTPFPVGSLPHLPCLHSPFTVVVSPSFLRATILYYLPYDIAQPHCTGLDLLH